MTRGEVAALLACGVLLALTAPARPQGACSYAYTGYLTGLPYQLPVTYLTPGVADWKVAVPLPVECAGAGGQAAGQEALACDHDARPGVRAVRGGLHVRRAGWLRGYATVQLTVYCVFPYPPPPLNTMLNMLPAQPNQLPAQPNALPALPNRSQNVTEPTLPSSAPTPQQSNNTVSSIATTTSPELLSSSDDEADEAELEEDEEELEEVEEELEEDSEVKPEDNRRLLQWQPAQFLQLPRDTYHRFMKFLHAE